jgi:bifunctional non-homologous end joining protein LigD
MNPQASFEINGEQVQVSNLQKVFYPATGFTKGNAIDYYVRISPVLLPHLKNRPLTLKRYPNGVEGEFFYEKQCPSHRPAWIRTAPVAKSTGGKIDYCLLNDLASLIWAANLADLELHTFLHQAPALQRPTCMAFDLDPGPPADIIQCCQIALWLKQALEAVGLKSYPKTSGSKGLQVYVPLNTPVLYAQTKAFAQTLTVELERQFPDQVVARMQKSFREGKVLVDWSQNDAHKTTVCVYSLRAKEHPTVSTPVTWDEVSTALKKRQPKQLVFEASEVLRRVERDGDLFAPVLTLKQKLPAFRPSN